MSRTYAIVQVSAAAYDEIKEKLAAAGYNDQILERDDHGTTLDMHGLALVRVPRIGMCEYCKKLLSGDHTCCAGCADERGP